MLLVVVDVVDAVDVVEGAAAAEDHQVKRHPAPQIWSLSPAQVILQSALGLSTAPAAQVLEQ